MTSTRLHAAIAAYRAAAGDTLDKHGCAVLDRLACDDRASGAFDKFGADDRAAAGILSGCIEADLLVRTFNDRLDTERAALDRLAALDKAVDDLRTFIAELEVGPKDRLSGYITHDPADMAAMKRGLGTLCGAIAARRRLANETRLRIGATRKTQDVAADTAAIGWIGEAVRRRCGQPYTEAAADLAEVVLRCEVSADRMREAERTRRKREWRSP
jgi:hypothetical protein